jgi:PTS system cellobiose-specific IIC component
MTVVAIVVNLPIPGLSDWMVSSGVPAAANEMINSSMSLLAIYASFLIAYVYTKNDGMNGVTAGVISMASFLMLVPSTVTINEETTMNAYQQNYLGSDGLFVAIILSLLVAVAFGWLTRKDIKLKLPDSVPPMVSDSLSPSFTTMIIFAVVFFIKWGLMATPFGNIFELIKQLVVAPLMNFGATPIAMVAIMTIANLVWFFGVHPSSVLSVYIPVFMTVTMAAIAQYQAGEPMTDAKFLMLYNCLYFGGTGNTIALCIDMFFALVEAGDEIAEKVLRTYCRRLAHLILNLQFVLDVQKFSIGGGISQAPALERVLREEFDRIFDFDMLRMAGFTKPELGICAFHNEANLIGALAHHKSCMR